MPPLIANAAQCFGPDVGGIEVLMIGLADQLAQSGRDVEVFAGRIRTAGAEELFPPTPGVRFGSIPDLAIDGPTGRSDARAREV